MGRLTNAEISHTKERLREIMKRREDELKEKHTSMCKTPTDQQLAEAVWDGDVSLRRRPTKANATAILDTTVREAFSFKSFEPIAILDKDAFNAESEPIRQAYRLALDKITLKDRTEALPAFEAFVAQYG